MLEIKNLHAEVDGQKILRGIDLTVNPGEVHAIMGPNGSGKSTLSYVLAGKDDYEITEGSVTYNGEDLLDMEPDQRAAAGVFLAFQYPIEIPGVGTMTFLRTSLNSQRKKRGEAELTTPEFMRVVRETAAKLNITQDMLKRPLNVGFSGGEKKRNEILQMALLQPKALPDGRDRFRPRHRCAAGGGRGGERAALAGALLCRDHPLPAAAELHRAGLRARHVEGRVVRSGGKELALELEERGYADYVGEAA
jgi:Fe-S cluster assembly ATP-binding protein